MMQRKIICFFLFFITAVTQIVAQEKSNYTMNWKTVDQFEKKD